MVIEEPLSPEQRVLRIARPQHLLISRRQCREAGLTAYQVRRRVRAGLWKEVRPDVFAVDGQEPSSWEAVVLAAVLAVADGVACGRTALWLHGVKALGKPEEIEVSAPLGCVPSLPGVRIRQRRALPETDRTVVRGVPTTSGIRTVIDLAPELDRLGRLAVLEESIDAEVVDRSWFVRRATEASNGRAGVRFMIAVADDDGRARFRSWLEREARRLFREAGLPEAEWNVVLRDGRGRIGEIDVVFPGGVVTVELDGLKFHSSAAQRRKDQQRDRRLLLSGRIPLRYGWRDIVERPQEVVAEIREALAR